jgi:hypothetical protein
LAIVSPMSLQAATRLACPGCGLLVALVAFTEPAPCCSPGPGTAVTRGKNNQGRTDVSLSATKREINLTSPPAKSCSRSPSSCHQLLTTLCQSDLDACVSPKRPGCDFISRGALAARPLGQGWPALLQVAQECAQHAVRHLGGPGWAQSQLLIDQEVLPNVPELLACPHAPPIRFLGCDHPQDDAVLPPAPLPRKFGGSREFESGRKTRPDKQRVSQRIVVIYSQRSGVSPPFFPTCPPVPFLLPATPAPS